MSETAELADVVLPGSVWCEDEGTTTNLEGRVIKINQAADAARRGAPRLGDRLRPGAAAGARPVLPVHARRARSGTSCGVASKGGVADYYGITWEKIDAQDGVFWPCPTEDHPGTPRLFTERFGHPDGRARMFPIAYTPPAEEPSGDYPVPPDHRPRGLPLPERHPDAAARLPEQPGAGAVGGDPPAGGRAARHRATTSVVRVRTPRGVDGAEGAGRADDPARTRCSSRSTTATAQAVNQLTNPAVEPTVQDPGVQGLRRDGRAARRAAADAPPATAAASNYTPRDATRRCSRTPSARRSRAGRSARREAHTRHY